MNEKKKKANMHTSQLDFFFSHQKEFFFLTLMFYLEMNDFASDSQTYELYLSFISAK